MEHTSKTLLGLDIGGTHVRIAIAQGHQIISMKSVSWPSGLTALNEVQFIINLVNVFLKEQNARDSISAVGVAFAAQVEQNGVVVQWPNRPSWSGIPFRSMLESSLGVPICIEDDANAAALGEWILGAAKEYKHVIMVTVGTGIGSGLICNGQLMRGKHGWAGELGHMVMLPEGSLCSCGRHGCLQTLVSGRRLEQVAQERGVISWNAIHMSIERGEEWILQLLSTYGYWLAIAIANVVNLLDLEAVIIGGGVSMLHPCFFSSMKTTLNANLLTPTHQHVILCSAAFLETSGLIGALYLVEQFCNSSKETI